MLLDFLVLCIRLGLLALHLLTLEIHFFDNGILAGFTYNPSQTWQIWTARLVDWWTAWLTTRPNGSWTAWLIT